MKTTLRLLSALITALLFATGTFAQTAEEILAKVDAQVNQPTDEGFFMVMEMKIPLIGTVGTDVYSRGDKVRMEINKDGKRSVTYIDGETHWDYDSSTNTVTIKTVKKDQPSEAKENMEMLKGVADGYTPKIQKETSDAWYIRCTKNKNNADKNDPKRMDLVVLKPDYRLKSVSANASILTITMRDFTYGIPESKVTFSADEFPGATIVDER